MKTIRKIVAALLIWLLSIGNVLAIGFPEEPMVIYGNVTGYGLSGKTMKISDTNGNLLKKVIIYNGKYGTNKTFDLQNKIILNSFDWKLVFEVWGYENTEINLGEITTCSKSPIFQKAWLCQYNLVFKEKTISADNIIIKEIDKSINIDDIFDWLIKEDIKTEIEKDLWDNILKEIDDTEEIIVSSNDLEITKNIEKNIIIVSESKKEAIHIPENTTIEESDVVIEKPVEIVNKTTIKHKINKDIVWAVEVPTNKQVNFNKYIRVCTKTTNSSSSNLEVYYSHDNTTWKKDNNAKNLIISDWQVCFSVNHLTSFAVATKTSSSSSSWSWWWGWSSKDLVYKTKVIKPIAKDIEENTTNEDKTIIKKETPIKKVPIKEKKKVETTKNYIVARDANWKVKVNWKLYILSLKYFNKEKKQEKKVFWYDVLNIKNDPEYNKQINNYTKEIYNDISKDYIRKEMIKYMDKMTITYGLYHNPKLDPSVKAIFEAKLKEDKEAFLYRLEKLKKKDRMIKMLVKKREANKQKILSKPKSDEKIEVKTNNKTITYSIAVWSVKMSANPSFTETAAWLYFWEKVRHISRTWKIVKVQVIDSRDGYTWKVWYISRRFLRELK